MPSFLVNILHDLFDPAVEQSAYMINGVGGYVFAPLHGVVVGQGKPQLAQPIGCDTLFLHGSEQRLITDHRQISPSNI